MFSSAVWFSPFPIFWVFSCDACVLFPSASSCFASAPWRHCRHSSGVVLLCPVRSWRNSLARPAALSPSPRSLRFSSFFFSGIFSEGAPGFFAFPPLWRLPLLLLLLLGVLRLLLLLLPLLSFMLLACGVSRFVGFWRDSFLSSVITAASCSSSSVFPSFSLRSFWFSSGVFVSGLLCLLTPWFPMFFAVFSFSGVSSFSSSHPSSLYLLRFRFPSFSAGIESLWRGGFSLFVASPLRR